MDATRRLMILGAATLAGAARAAPIAPPATPALAPDPTPIDFHDLLAAGRAAQASATRED